MSSGIIVSSSMTPEPPPQTIYSIAAGMWLAMTAFLDQIQAIQTYQSQGLIPLSSDIQQQGLTQANAWIQIMSGTTTPIPAGATRAQVIALNPATGLPMYSDQQILAWDAANGGSNMAAYIQTDSATLNTHNTLYNQASSFWSGMNNSTNQNSSSVLQTIQIALQMYQQGPQSALQTIAAIL